MALALTSVCNRFHPIKNGVLHMHKIFHQQESSCTAMKKKEINVYGNVSAFFVKGKQFLKAIDD